MKKILKRVFGVLGALIALFVLFVVVKFYVLLPKSRPAADMKAPNTPEAIARGEYLATHVAGCNGCHSEVDETKAGAAPVPGKEFQGRDFGEIPNYPVHIRARNITPDKETGIGNWTDGEIVRAMREGVSRDGSALFPQMPYAAYSETLSDEDALAIVAYLRTVKPIHNIPGKTEVKFPVSMFIRAAPKPLEKPPAPEPPASDKIARGNWLITVCQCHDCHDTRDDHMEKIPGKSLAGGTKFPLSATTYVYPSNITSDKATGIGSYSDEDIARAVEQGKGKDGRDLYMMPWAAFAGMTADDRAALYAALRQVPPVANLVPPSKTK